MSIFSGLEEIVETDYQLAKETWYGLGGPADYFIRPKTVKQLKEVVRRCNENKIPICVMGLGSNLLISDEGLRAAVIKLKGDEFEQIRFDGEQLTAWAGVELSKLVLWMPAETSLRRASRSWVSITAGQTLPQNSF